VKPPRAFSASGHHAVGLGIRARLVWGCWYRIGVSIRLGISGFR
jgi:hypothetical protein